MSDAKHNSNLLSEHEASELRSLIESRSGLLFDKSRERFLMARVLDYATAKRLSHGSDVLRLVKTSNLEYEALLQALLTQETSFFRYPDVFDAFRKHVLPEMHMKKFWENPRALRVWSAGCSTGQEAYSIAISIAETVEFLEAWNIQVLATDVSRPALQHAERGVYPRSQIETLTPAQVQTYFVKVGDQFMVKPRIRNLVNFAPVNLAQPIYVGRFDCIFCMNVLIYFSAERQQSLVRRFYDYLEPGGYLFLGHAESVTASAVNFNTIYHGNGRIYQKPVEPHPIRPNAVSAGEVMP